MKINAYAKINLCLDVIGKRPDGYHELDMIMMPLCLHDTLQVEIAAEDSFTCSLPQLRMDASNTVVKAVELMRRTYGIQTHFHIHVDKKIPAQAGLAGGSADGAAVLRAIRALCKVDVSLPQLAQLGKQIGADVPFCVLNRCAIVRGIGEILEPFIFTSDVYVVLVKPPQGVPTGKAFGMLDHAACPHPDVQKVKAVLCTHDYAALADVIANSLEYSAFQLVPEIEHIKKQLQAMGCDAVLMSGSGSTVFTLCEDARLANTIVATYREKAGYFATATHFLTECDDRC